MYDSVSVYRTTGDESGTSNGIISATASSNKTAIRVHKVVLVLESGNASTAMTVVINDHLTIASSATIISLAASSGSAMAEDEYDHYVEANFSPPVQFNTGLSVNVGTQPCACYVYYTRI